MILIHLNYVHGYNKSIIENYNKKVIERIENVSNIFNIPIEKYAPKDKKGKSHMLGLFEYESDKEDGSHTYDEFITQGAKKYAFSVDGKIGITVAGVPKTKGAKGLHDLNDFRDNFVFDYKDTGKQLLVYNENQIPFDLVDYKGEKMKVCDKTGICFLPTTYVLGKALDYSELLSDESSKRSIYKE